MTKLANPAAFFASIRTGLLGPALSDSEVSGCNAILAACEGWRLSWTAYALATAYHEAAHTMQPVSEIGNVHYFRRMYDIEGGNPALAKRLGNTEPGDGAKYAGRGYVQLTGRGNYAKAERELHEPLIANPACALRPDVAAEIMRRGMEEGWFTGRGMATYLTSDHETLANFTQARKIINGLDRAELIAGYAMQFQDALEAGKWS